MIRVEHLRKQFGKVRALDDVNFTVGRGEIVGILGPNGAGKTTLMRILAGVFPPSGGKVEIHGVDLAKNVCTAQRTIGYLPESSALYGELTVLEMLAFLARLKCVPSRAMSNELARVLDICGLALFKHQLIRTLSKGFKQRVALAGALLGSPELLILDEPTSGLDPEQIVEMRQLIRSLGGERTIVLSTHLLHEVTQLTEHILIIQGGRLVADDRFQRPDDFLLDQEKLVLAILGEPEQVFRVVSGISMVEGVRLLDADDGVGKPLRYAVRTRQAEEAAAVLASRVVESGLRLVELRQPKSALEDLYLKRVKESVQEKMAHRA